jgi:hypothetical protein
MTTVQRLKTPTVPCAGCQRPTSSYVGVCLREECSELRMQLIAEYLAEYGAQALKETQKAFRRAKRDRALQYDRAIRAEYRQVLDRPKILAQQARAERRVQRQERHFGKANRAQDPCWYCNRVRPRIHPDTTMCIECYTQRAER